MQVFRRMKYPSMIRFVIWLIIFVPTSCNNKEEIRCSTFLQDYSKFIEPESTSDTITLIKTLTKTLMYDSNCIDAYLERADIYYMKDSTLLDALNDYKKVISINAENVYANYRAGCVFFEWESYDTAIYYFKRSIDLKTYKGTIINYNKSDFGVDNYKSKYDVDFNLLKYKIGQAQYYSADFASSIASFSFCISNKYSLDKSFLYRGAAYLELNKPNRACLDFIESNKLGNKDAERYLEKYCSKL